MSAARWRVINGMTPGKALRACAAGAKSRPALASKTVGAPPRMSAATPSQPRRSSASPERASNGASTNPATANRMAGDVPCRQAGAKAQAADDDVSGPDADRSQPAQRTVRICGGLRSRVIVSSMNGLAAALRITCKVYYRGYNWSSSKACRNGLRMSNRGDPFEWSGGHPALDLVNTLDERPFDAPIENLATYRDSGALCRACGFDGAAAGEGPARSHGPGVRARGQGVPASCASNFTMSWLQSARGRANPARRT